MNFGSHIGEIIDYLHAKFQVPTTTLSSDFQTGSGAVDANRKLPKIPQYEKLRHEIDQ